MNKLQDPLNPQKLLDNTLKSNKCWLDVYSGFRLDNYSHLEHKETEEWVMHIREQYMCCAKCMTQLHEEFYFCNQFEIIFCQKCDQGNEPVCYTMQNPHEHFWIAKTELIK